MHGMLVLLEVVTGIVAALWFFSLTNHQGRRRSRGYRRYSPTRVNPNARFFSKEQTQRAMIRQRRRCANPECRTKLFPGNFQRDHIRPVAWGGKTTDDNIQLLCVHCHDAKTRAEFPGYRGKGRWAS